MKTRAQYTMLFLLLFVAFVFAVASGCSMLDSIGPIRQFDCTKRPPIELNHDTTIAIHPSDSICVKR